MEASMEAPMEAEITQCFVKEMCQDKKEALYTRTVLFLNYETH